MPDHADPSPDPTHSGPALGRGTPGSETLAAALEPALRTACDGRLGPVEWFHSAWQAGGAATGRSTFTLPDGTARRVIVKLPVGPLEFEWTTLLGSPEHAPGERCTPVVLASGREVGGYDLAWLVLERLEGTPLSTGFDRAALVGLLAAAVRWYALSGSARPVSGEPKREDWPKLIAKAREATRLHAVQHEQRWNGALKSAERALPRILPVWEARPLTHWCHGDLHPGNAMRRPVSPESAPASTDAGAACVLIDLALVHPGHFVEDAVYLERLYWAKPEMLFGLKPASEMARLLRERGESPGEYAQLAHVRRLLMAVSAPAYLGGEGHPKYIQAALEVLERTLPLV